MNNSETDLQKIIREYKVSYNELQIIQPERRVSKTMNMSVILSQTDSSQNSDKRGPENPSQNNLNRFNKFLKILKNAKNGGADYFSQFSSVYVANKILLEKIGMLIDEKEELNKSLSRLEQGSSSLLNRGNPRLDKKRKNRSREEVVKNIQCKFKGCDKLYGSNSAMILHMRRKHDYK